MININCKNCYNPLGTLKNKVLKIDNKRISESEMDLENVCTTIKCRRCSHVSVISFKDKLVNEIDYKRTEAGLLG